jgi:phage shock protein PspC (stress-responsive transcriptional regulator)
MQVNPRRLYRSHDRQLAGVAAGMAEYLDVDPTVIRILWIIVGLMSAGLALVVYIVLALVIPQAPYPAMPGAWAPGAGMPTPGAWTPTPPTGTPTPGAWTSTPGGPAAGTGWGTPPAAPAWNPGWDASAYAAPQGRRRAESRGIGAAGILGVLLIVFGGIALMDAALPDWSARSFTGPAVVLALGAALLAASVRRRSDDAPAQPPTGEPPAARNASAPAAAPATQDPWATTDTQPVDPAGFGSASGTSGMDAGQGASPA